MKTSLLSDHARIYLVATKIRIDFSPFDLTPHCASAFLLISSSIKQFSHFDVLFRGFSTVCELFSKRLHSFPNELHISTTYILHRHNNKKKKKNNVCICVLYFAKLYFSFYCVYF
jgi:hypothetical protein